jgi:hypothetical protein
MRISQNAREGSDKRNETNSGLYFSQTSRDERKARIKLISGVTRVRAAEIDEVAGLLIFLLVEAEAA